MILPVTLDQAALARRTTRRRLIGLGAAVALLIGSNLLSNLVFSGWAYIGWNLLVALLLLAIAAWAGIAPAGVGLSVKHWHRPVGVGLLLAASAALVFAIGMAIPATRSAFLDQRAGSATFTGMLFQVLIRIPLGTVVLEEVAFRGVLPALMGAAPSVRWRWGPVLGASVLFGLWHILPSLGIAVRNEAVHEALDGSQWLATLLAVTSMTVVGVLMCAMARLGKGIKTTMLLHWASNSLGFVAAWLLMR